MSLSRTVLLSLVLVMPQTYGAFAADPAPTQATDLVQLGKLLFADKDLSHNRTQACATCHDPARGFTDGHGRGHNGAFSLGDDGASLGGRNAPSVAYAALSPAFIAVPGMPPSGGQFWDGRATDLLEKATGPVFNPVEMAVESKVELASRLINPESGRAWDGPEVNGTLSLTELQFGPALDDKRIDAFGSVPQDVHRPSIRALAAPLTALGRSGPCLGNLSNRKSGPSQT